LQGLPRVSSWSPLLPKSDHVYQFLFEHNIAIMKDVAMDTVAIEQYCISESGKNCEPAITLIIIGERCIL